MYTCAVEVDSCDKFLVEVTGKNFMIRCIVENCVLTCASYFTLRNHIFEL